MEFPLYGRESVLTIREPGTPHLGIVYWKTLEGCTIDLPITTHARARSAVTGYQK